MANATHAGILRALRAADGYIDLGDLAERLGLTLPALALQISELQSAGYDIAEHPHIGYRFIAGPERIIADDLSGMLEGVRLAQNILVFERIGSTNDLATRMGREGKSEGLVIFAEEQTSGRGRLGRRWESDSRLGLWFSVLLRPAFSSAVWTRLTTWAAVAIAEAIEAETSCRAAIKWPNDIYIEEKKAVGILTESHFDMSQNGFAVLGVGINVNHESFSSELAGKAISLRMATGHFLDRQILAASVIRKLDALYSALHSDFTEILAKADKRSFLHGKTVRVDAGGRRIEGVAERLNEDGALVLRSPDGSETIVSSGEVMLAVD